jgi:hypothetical protein
MWDRFRYSSFRFADLPGPDRLYRYNLELSSEETTVSEKKPERDLEPPPMASNPHAVEVLRVWATPGQPQQLTLRTTWKDAGAWGLLLADIARHAAKAYAAEGHDAAEVLARIRQLMNREFSQPTDEPTQLG